MIIKKTYAGSQTRQLLPKDKNIGGVIGDAKSTILQFKFPKDYDIGGSWQRFIEFDCYALDKYGKEVQPRYALTDNKFQIPAEIAENNIGKTVNYNLVFIKDEGRTVEKSEQATIYFRASANGEYEPIEREYWVEELYEKALGKVRITTNSDDLNPITLHYDGIGGGEVQPSENYPIPYLVAGKIPEKFLSSNFIVSVYKITTSDELTTLKQAEPPDLAWVVGDVGKDDLYILVDDDYSDPNNWILIHTENPIFESVGTQALEVVGQTTTEYLEVVKDTVTNIKSAILVTNDTGKVVASDITLQELENLADSRGNIQLQLDNKTDLTQAIPQWDKNTTYNKSSTVVYADIIYISIVDNNKGVLPSSTKDKWKMVQGSGGGGEPNTYTEIIGDGINTVYEIEHGLNTANLFTSIKSFDGTYVDAAVKATSLNTIEVTFNRPPAFDEPKTVIVSPGAYGVSSGGEGGWGGYTRRFTSAEVWTIKKREVIGAPSRYLTVQVLDSNNHMMMAQIEQNNTEIIIRFNEATAGTVVLT